MQQEWPDGCNAWASQCPSLDRVSTPSQRRKLNLLRPVVLHNFISGLDDVGGLSAAYRYIPHDSTLQILVSNVGMHGRTSSSRQKVGRGLMNNTQRWNMGGRHMGGKLIPVTQQLAICTATPRDWQPEVRDNVLHVRLIQPRCLGMRSSPSSRTHP